MMGDSFARGVARRLGPWLAAPLAAVLACTQTPSTPSAGVASQPGVVDAGIQGAGEAGASVDGSALCLLAAGAPSAALASFASIDAAYGVSGGSMPNLFWRAQDRFALEGRCYAADRPDPLLLLVHLRDPNLETISVGFAFDLDGSSGWDFGEMQAQSPVDILAFAPRFSLSGAELEFQTDPTQIVQDADGEFRLAARVTSDGRFLVVLDSLDPGATVQVPSMRCEVYREIVPPGACLAAPDTLLPGARGSFVTSGVPVTVSDDMRVMKVFRAQVPQGTPSLTMRTAGGSGAPTNLYARFGDPPTVGVYDASSVETGTNDELVIGAPQAGEWYVGVLGIDPYENVQLTVSW